MLVAKWIKSLWLVSIPLIGIKSIYRARIFCISRHFVRQNFRLRQKKILGKDAVRFKASVRTVFTENRKTISKREPPLFSLNTTIGPHFGLYPTKIHEDANQPGTQPIPDIANINGKNARKRN